MKILITALAVIALSSCASVRIDIVTSEYIPKPQYCYDGIQGELDQTKSSPSMAAITVNGAIYYAPFNDLKEC